MVGKVALVLAVALTGCRDRGDGGACQGALDRARMALADGGDADALAEAKRLCSKRAAEVAEVERRQQEAQERAKAAPAPAPGESEFAEFSKWAASVLPDLKAKTDGVECHKKPDPEAGWCDSLTVVTTDSGIQRSYWARWRQTDPSAYRLMHSANPPQRWLGCKALERATVRRWRYAASVNERCGEGDEGAPLFVVNQFEGAIQSTRLIMFSPAYERADEAFAKHIRAGRDEPDD